MHNFIKTDAFCLKVKPVRNQSAILLFFTKELGVISLFQKGFFAVSNNLSGVLDIGQEVSLLLKKYRNSMFIHETSLIASYNTADYHVLTLSSFVFELLGSLPQKIDLNTPYIYSLLRTMLSQMSVVSGKFNMILNFEVKLLFELGLTGNPEICSSCHKSFIKNTPSFSLLGELNFICSNCSHGTFKYNDFSENERQVISLWLNTSDLNSARHLGKNSVLKLQNHINTIFDNMMILKSLMPFMKIMYDEAQTN